MKVTNNTTFHVSVHLWSTRHGYGTPIAIAPGDTKDVRGPKIQGDAPVPCFLEIRGEVEFRENGGDNKGAHQYQINKTHARSIKIGTGTGIAVMKAPDYPPYKK